MWREFIKAYGTNIWLDFHVSIQGPVSRKSGELFGPEKPFVKLRPAYSGKPVFSYVVKGINIKINAKFRASTRLRFDDLLSERHTLEKSKNRKILLSILSNIRYLARQALPLRGRDWNTETMSEENSNFYQLLKPRAQENPEIIEWLQKEIRSKHHQRFRMTC